MGLNPQALDLITKTILGETDAHDPAKCFPNLTRWVVAAQNLSASRPDCNVDRQVQLDQARLQQRHGQVIAQFNPCVGIARRSPELLEDNLPSPPKRRPRAA